MYYLNKDAVWPPSNIHSLKVRRGELTGFEGKEVPAHHFRTRGVVLRNLTRWSLSSGRRTGPRV